MAGLFHINEAISIALHICIFLADSDNVYIPAREVAEKLGFSVSHSTKVVQQLARSGILDTLRGPSGGARLAQAASDITLMDIYMATGSQPKHDECLLKHSVCDGSRCMIGTMIRAEKTKMISMFSRTTLEDVVQSLGSNFFNKDVP